MLLQLILRRLGAAKADFSLVTLYSSPEKVLLVYTISPSHKDTRFMGRDLILTLAWTTLSSTLETTPQSQKANSTSDSQPSTSPKTYPGLFLPTLDSVLQPPQGPKSQGPSSRFMEGKLHHQ